MPELTPQELNVTVAKAAGYFVSDRCGGLWALIDPHGKDVDFIYGGRNEEDAWNKLARFLPDFSGDLNECTPLRDAMQKAGWKYEFRSDKDGTISCHVYEILHGQPVGRHFCIRDQTYSTALCRAYLKFKELTKEEINGQGV